MEATSLLLRGRALPAFKITDAADTSAAARPTYDSTFYFSSTLTSITANATQADPALPIDTSVGWSKKS